MMKIKYVLKTCTPTTLQATLDAAGEAGHLVVQVLVLSNSAWMVILATKPEGEDDDD